MATYKTPDVYVEEISLFPPSVAEVETAIPAFIGYTEKAENLEPNDLNRVPTLIKSLVEYESLFGGAAPIKVTEVVLDGNNAVASHKVESSFYMYDSLRLFFKNGGGKCYIISVGSYKDTIDKADFEEGLSKLKKQDEPTIILFPDAARLEQELLSSLQQAALKQCEELQDRFGLFDVLEPDNADNAIERAKTVKAFRDGIGMENLKYGAAYTPWIKSILGLDVHYRHIQNKIKRGGVTVSLKEFTEDNKVEETVTNLDNAISDITRVEDVDVKELRKVKPAPAADSGDPTHTKTIRDNYTKLVDSFKGEPDKAKFQALFNFIYDMVNVVDKWVEGGSVLKTEDFKKSIKGLIKNSLKKTISNLISYDRGTQGAASLNETYDLYKAKKPSSGDWGGIFDGSEPDADSTIYTGSNKKLKMKAAEPYISDVFNNVYSVVTSVVNSMNAKESTLESSLYENHPIYQRVIKKLNTSLTELPPSGAVAGVYASVDRKRGVWKAPANVSLSSVSAPTTIIDNVDQETLNVDTIAGKSINAIRPFTGKGTLIWGARTLDGNSNEWRYINVRRFFNMVEESVKKSTYFAVFEANDANTWIKVKSMIENYLIKKWRDGALFGDKPEKAFFVNVGLGTTMTAIDILEGRMNVEIGMAVVRPAEFIILKFSHKMPEA